MWIRSKCKTLLIDTKIIFTDGNELLAVFEGDDQGDYRLIGSFDTPEEAIEELDRIQEHIVNGCPGVYQVAGSKS